MDAMIMDHGVVQMETKPIRRRRRVRKIGTLAPEQQKKWEDSIDQVISIVLEKPRNENRPIISPVEPVPIAKAPRPIDYDPTKALERRKPIRKRKRRTFGKYLHLVIGIISAFLTGLWFFFMLSVMGTDLHITAKCAGILFCAFTMYLNFTESCSRISRAARKNRRGK